MSAPVNTALHHTAPLILTPLGRYLHNTCTAPSPRTTADNSDHSRQHRVTPDLVIILVAGGEEGGDTGEKTQSEETPPLLRHQESGEVTT